MQVDFYHLTATPLARALPQVAGRVVADGGRLLIVSADQEQRGAIDRLLWAFAPDSFLAHAQASEADDNAQPILIASDITDANSARFVAIVDGAWRDMALSFERVFHFFDDDRVQEARLAWKGLAARDGVERRYWKQDDNGRWERAA